MGSVDGEYKFFKFIKDHHNLSVSRRIKFRNKDLRKLKRAYIRKAKNINEAVSCLYLDTHFDRDTKELILTNLVKDLIPYKNPIFDMLPKNDDSLSGTYIKVPFEF